MSTLKQQIGLSKALLREGKYQPECGIKYMYQQKAHIQNVYRISTNPSKRWASPMKSGQDIEGF